MTASRAEACADLPEPAASEGLSISGSVVTVLAEAAAEERVTFASLSGERTVSVRAIDPSEIDRLEISAEGTAPILFDVLAYAGADEATGMQLQIAVLDGVFELLGSDSAGHRFELLRKGEATADRGRIEVSVVDGRASAIFEL